MFAIRDDKDYLSKDLKQGGNCLNKNFRGDQKSRPMTVVSSPNVNLKFSEKIEEPLEISIKDIGFSVNIPKKKTSVFQKQEYETKHVLKGITAKFHAGRLTAVMGASGAGKTSLLNVLSGEAKNGTIAGVTMVNGVALKNNREMKNLSGFVFQDDVILDTMTVREAVFMSAKLRLPSDVSDEVKYKSVDDLLALLRLTKAANTIIGNTTVKGISGGERKRTALAMEMITNPSILFLDEPTSGLDTFTAYAVCDILKSLTSTGRTVIATIHQPSSETFHLFDDLCLLSEGKIMYMGPIHGVVTYFSELGYPCPQYTNPADFIFMSILNSDANSPSQHSDSDKIETRVQKDKERIDKLLKSWESSHQAAELEEAALKTKGKVGFGSVQVKFKASYLSQFQYLAGRALRNALRNKLIVRAKLGQAIFVALIIGLIYFNINRLEFNEQSQNRNGVLFFICVNLTISSTIGVLSIFALEKSVFIREYSAGYYNLSTYFFSKTLVELPFQIVFPFIQTLILYWMVGLSTRKSYSFAIFALVVILLSNCGTALGIFFASIFSDLPVALNVAPMILLPIMIFGGLFVNNGSIPVYFDWIKYLSPIKYGYEALMRNEYDGWTGSTIINGKTVDFTGDDMLNKAGYQDDGFTVGSLLGILFAIYIGFLGLAYFALFNTTRANR